MKVWVVYDPLYEKVMSVHKTERGADERRIELNDEDDRWEEKTCEYEYCYEELELED